MSTTSTYNGWTNYETWLVFTWLTNDCSSASYWESQATEVWEATEAEEYLSKSEAARRELGFLLRDETDEGNPLADGASLYSDLLSAALSEVDWDDIADSLLQAVDGYEPRN
jgi:hypothetical protein